jgi:hypothetical protein
VIVVHAEEDPAARRAWDRTRLGPNKDRLGIADAEEQSASRLPRTGASGAVRPVFEPRGVAVSAGSGLILIVPVASIWDVATNHINAAIGPSLGGRDDGGPRMPRSDRRWRRSVLRDD